MTETVRGADTRRILIASLAAAVSSFAILTIAARVLPPEGNRQFLVYWAVLFGVFGVLSGIQHETTRAVSSGHHGARQHEQGPPARPVHGASTSVLGSAALLGLGAALVLLTTAMLWAPARFPSATLVSVLLITGAAVLYACHASVAGASAGSSRWRLYADLMGTEAVVRLLAVALVAGLLVSGLLSGTDGLVAMQLATAGAAVVWIGFVLLTREGAATAGIRVDLTARQVAGRRLGAMFTAACTAVLITGYPTFIDASAGSEPAVRVAALLFMLSLTRAPIMIPLQALQGVAITAFVRQRDRPLAALLPVMAKVGGLSAIAAVAAALVGPWALRIINPVYDSHPLTWAGLTVAGGTVAVLTLSGTAALAVDRHGDYAAGWLLACVLGVAGLWLPLPLDLRVILALIVGPLLGAALHLALLHRQGRHPSPSPANPSETKDIP